MADQPKREEIEITSGVKPKGHVNERHRRSGRVPAEEADAEGPQGGPLGVPKQRKGGWKSTK